MSAIHEALDKQMFCNVLLLLDKGQNPNVHDKQGRTVLMKCCYLDDRKVAHIIARRAIKRGAKRDICDRDGRNALSYAVWNRHIGICKLIINGAHIDLNHRDRKGNTVLHEAVLRRYPELVRLIMADMTRYRLPVDEPDARGMTALMLACSQGDLETARYLVHEGKASLTMRDNLYFRSARDWLDTVFVVPVALDPFRKTLPIGIFQERPQPAKLDLRKKALTKFKDTAKHGDKPPEQTIGTRPRPRTADVRTGQTTGGSVNRAHSAPAFRLNPGDQTLLSYQEQTLAPNCDMRNSDHSSSIFIQLYTLYAIKSSNAYRCPATPVTTLPAHQDTSRRQTTKSRIQKLMRIKRAESIFSSLKKNKSFSESSRKFSYGSNLSLQQSTIPEDGHSPEGGNGTEVPPRQSRGDRASDSGPPRGHPRTRRRGVRQMSSSSFTSVSSSKSSVNSKTTESLY